MIGARKTRFLWVTLEVLGLTQSTVLKLTNILLPLPPRLPSAITTSPLDVLTFLMYIGCFALYMCLCTICRHGTCWGQRRHCLP